MKSNIINLLAFLVLLFCTIKGTPRNFSCGKLFGIGDIPTKIVTNKNYELFIIALGILSPS